MLLDLFHRVFYFNNQDVQYCMKKNIVQNFGRKNKNFKSHRLYFYTEKSQNKEPGKSLAYIYKVTSMLKAKISMQMWHLAIKCLRNSVCVCACVCVLFGIKCSTLQIQGKTCYMYISVFFFEGH